MEKPSWDNAPPWANYLAQNDDGQWFWYELKPSISFTMGYFFAELGGEYEEAEYANDWENSLEQRGAKIGPPIPNARNKQAGR